MKAVLGILSDSVPLFGYHKISYILIASTIGTIAYAIVGLVNFTSKTAPTAVILLFFTQFEAAVIDLLTEGKYAQLMVENPSTSSDLVSFSWAIFFSGSLFGSLVTGPLADHFNPRVIFLVCIPLAAQVIVPVVCGFFPERRLAPGQRGIRRDRLRAHSNMFRLAGLVTLSSGVVSAGALFGSPVIQSTISGITAVTLSVLGYMWLPPMIREANLYMFLASTSYIAINGATDYWYTANAQCVPNGPHFSYTFFNTYASFVSSLAGVVGVVLFQRLFSQRRFRVVFAVTICIKVIGSIPDLIMVNRLNLRIGLPDSITFLLGDSLIQKVAAMLDILPSLVLTSKVCPPGMEASMIAILVSYINLGTACARAIGVGLINAFGVKTTTPCNFDGLSGVIFVAHVVAPLLAFPLVFLLVPDVKMTDDLVGQGETERLRHTNT